MVQGCLVASAMGGVIQAVTRDTALYPKRYADRLIVQASSGNRAGAQARDTLDSTVDFGSGTAYPFPDIFMDRVQIPDLLKGTCGASR